MELLWAKNQLNEASLLLCTFNIPIGRYRFKRLPFGIKCDPAIFQRTMDQMGGDLDGVEVIMDDVIITGDDATHDKRLMKFLERPSKGPKTKQRKMQDPPEEVPYEGHLFTAEGLKFHPQKVKAIHEMPEPKTKEDVKWLHGFVQFLSRYLPRCSLRELEKSDVLFQMESFRKIKQLVSQAPVLQYYDVDKPVTIQCDASGKGLGAALL